CAAPLFRCFFCIPSTRPLKLNREAGPGRRSTRRRICLVSASCFQDDRIAPATSTPSKSIRSLPKTSKQKKPSWPSPASNHEQPSSGHLLEQAEEEAPRRRRGCLHDGSRGQ